MQDEMLSMKAAFEAKLRLVRDEVRGGGGGGERGRVWEWRLGCVRVYVCLASNLTILPACHVRYQPVMSVISLSCPLSACHVRVFTDVTPTPHPPPLPTG